MDLNWTAVVVQVQPIKGGKFQRPASLPWWAAFCILPFVDVAEPPLEKVAL